MVEMMGEISSPKSFILKQNSIIPLTNNLGGLTYQAALLRSAATIDMSTLDTFSGDIAALEANYDGYSRVTLTNISRVDNLQNGYLWLADDLLFDALFSSVRYIVIFESVNKHIISVIDLEDVYTFAGDITFTISVQGFLHPTV